jgi:hypothetical protein
MSVPGWESDQPERRERLPDTRTPGVKRLMQQFRIPENNSLLLLATLGKQAVTDPFEFQLSAT